MTDTCLRCSDMDPTVFRRASRADLVAADNSAFVCMRCAGLSLAQVECVVYRLHEVSSDALCAALRSRGFAVHQFVMGPSDLARVAAEFYASTPPSDLETSHKER